MTPDGNFWSSFFHACAKWVRLNTMALLEKGVTLPEMYVHYSVYGRHVYIAENLQKVQVLERFWSFKIAYS